MLRNHFIKSSAIEQPNYTIYYTADSKVPFIGGEQTRNLTMWETGDEPEPLATFKVLKDSFADGYGLWSIKTSNPSCFYGLIKDKNGSEYSMDSGNTNVITGLIFPDYDLDWNYITEIGGLLLGYGEGNNLTDITLPSNLQYIGDSTFKGSTYLQTITIPELVKRLGNYAFLNCLSLSLISLPLNVEFIGEDCFKGCTNLVDFYCNSSTPPSLNGCDIFGDYTDIPNLTINVLYLGKYLTNDDWKLYSTIIKLHPKTIGYKAQNGVRLDLRYWDDFSIQAHNYNSGYGVIISNNELVTKVPDYAFQSIPEITDIFLPESITHIGKGAFNRCTSLTNINLPKTIQVLDTVCFGYTKLSEITLTKSVTKIGQGVFINTPLLRFVYEGTLEDWCKINFSTTLTLYDVASSNPMYYGAEKVYIDGKILEGEIILPPILNRLCIVNNNLIHSVIIPENTSEVQAPIIRNCGSLTKVQWNATDCQVIRESSVGVFSGCSSLTEFIFGDTVKSIPSYICRDCNISKVIIPDSVTSIGEEAFYKCSSLNSIVIGNNVTSIGKSAFRDCKFLTAVELPESVTSIGNDAFRGCSYITSMVIPDSVTSIGSSAFLYCGLRSIVIPNSITSIESYTFYECAALTSITIPESVTSIGRDAFGDCKYLPSIVIPNSVTSIGSSAFRGCSSLRSIIIPASVTSIGDYVFDNCSSLTSMVVAEGNTVYDSREQCNAIIKTATNNLLYGCKNTIIPTSVTRIGYRAFEGCSSLTSIEIPDGVKSIGLNAFEDCSSLISITIPNSVTSIESSAFYGCSSLTTVVIGNGVKSIGSSTFSGCDSLTSITFNGTKAQWNRITLEYYWNGSAQATVIHCTDGDITL